MIAAELCHEVKINLEMYQANKNNFPLLSGIYFYDVFKVEIPSLFGKYINRMLF